MKISVVVCSRVGIPQKLRDSITKCQTYNPDEIIEVVGNSLTQQRNRGAKQAIGDLITFLDDDLLLAPDYFEKILEVFYEHDDAMAVTGNIYVNAFKPNILHTIFAYIFLLSRRGKGKFLISGFPETYDKRIIAITKSEVLHGCNMTVRKEVFRELWFNEDMESGMYGEDDWFSYEAKKKEYPVYYTPFACCYDEREYPRGRQRWSTRCRIINLVKRFRERKCGIVGKIAFWWSMVGFFILKITEAIMMRDFSIIRGIYATVHNKPIVK